MVRVCRIPAFSRGMFAGNELSGWSEDVPQDYLYDRRNVPAKPRKHRKKKAVASTPAVIPPVIPVEGIVEL